MVPVRLQKRSESICMHCTSINHTLCFVHYLAAQFQRSCSIFFTNLQNQDNCREEHFICVIIVCPWPYLFTGRSNLRVLVMSTCSLWYNVVWLHVTFSLPLSPELLYDDVFSVWETIWAAKYISSPHFVLFIALALVEFYRDIILDNNMDFTDIIKFFNGLYFQLE